MALGLDKRVDMLNNHFVFKSDMANKYIFIMPLYFRLDPISS